MKNSLFGFTLFLGVLILGLTVFPTQTSFSEHETEVLITIEENGNYRVHISDIDGIASVSIFDSFDNFVAGIAPPGCPNHTDQLFFVPIEGKSYYVQWEDCAVPSNTHTVNPLPDPIADIDNDGIDDDIDNCPTISNPDQLDTDSDGIGDACNDADDRDGDEYADDIDNCPRISNPDQLDTDSDGIGDACDKSGSTDEKKSCDALAKENPGEAKGKERAKANNGCDDTVPSNSL